MKYAVDTDRLSEAEIYIYASTVAYGRLLARTGYRKMRVHWSVVLEEIQAITPLYSSNPLLVESIIHSFWEAYEFIGG